VILAADECYVEFTGGEIAPVTALHDGSEGVLALHSLSKRSNMAGMRVGFVAGDPVLIKYLGETRKHAGLMIPSPMQAAGIAALSDDQHVEEQRQRYARRRARLVEALSEIGIVHDGGPSAFYLWLRDRDRPIEAWTLATRFARAGVLVAPGDLYGPDGAHHVRLALTLTDEQVERIAANVAHLEE
jgi:aspartate/methionine/tyrosine aminotransferase